MAVTMMVVLEGVWRAMGEVCWGIMSSSTAVSLYEQ